ncbi:unnamed protein product [Amoebophrya sp. A120]|nr:unnamed protein product [Amoebophrya sp. A120]|eukprot:GSA120T00001479001.1
MGVVSQFLLPPDHAGVPSLPRHVAGKNFEATSPGLSEDPWSPSSLWTGTSAPSSSSGKKITLSVSAHPFNEIKKSARSSSSSFLDTVGSPARSGSFKRIRQRLRSGRTTRLSSQDFFPTNGSDGGCMVTTAQTSVGKNLHESANGTAKPSQHVATSFFPTVSPDLVSSLVAGTGTQVLRRGTGQLARYLFGDQTAGSSTTSAFGVSSAFHPLSGGGTMGKKTAQQQLHQTRLLEGKLSGGRSSRHTSFLSLAENFGAIGIFYGVGILMYGFTPHDQWSDSYFPEDKGKPGLVDCLIEGGYYATQVLTTIGYGDVYPKGNFLRIVNIFYILAGVGVAGSLVLGTITDQITDRVKDAEKRQLLATLTDAGDPHGAGGSMEKPERDRLKRRMEVTEGMLLVTVPTLLGSLVYGAVHNWGVAGSLHWAVVTNSTVGFGAYSIDNRAMRLFSIAYMNIAVASFALGLTKLTGVLLDEVQSSELDPDSVTLDQALGMDSDGDKRVDKYEFATGCLLSCGKVTETDMTQIMNRFRQLDRDGNGFLTIEDLPGQSQQGQTQPETTRQPTGAAAQ